MMMVMVVAVLTAFSAVTLGGILVLPRLLLLLLFADALGRRPAPRAAIKALAAVAAAAAATTTTTTTTVGLEVAAVLAGGGAQVPEPGQGLVVYAVLVQRGRRRRVQGVPPQALAPLAPPAQAQTPGPAVLGRVVQGRAGLLPVPGARGRGSLLGGAGGLQVHHALLLLLLLLGLLVDAVAVLVVLVVVVVVLLGLGLGGHGHDDSGVVIRVVLVVVVAVVVKRVGFHA